MCRAAPAKLPASALRTKQSMLLSVSIARDYKPLVHSDAPDRDLLECAARR
jgi:hypothetical protein